MVDLQEAHDTVNSSDQANSNGLANIFVSARSVETESGDVVFRLREDCTTRRIIFRVVRSFPSSLSIVEVKRFFLGNIHSVTTTRKSAVTHTPPYYTAPPPNLSSSKDWVNLPARLLGKDTIVADWDDSSRSDVNQKILKAFEQRTVKGQRLTFSVAVELTLKDYAKPLQVCLTSSLLPYCSGIL